MTHAAAVKPSPIISLRLMTVLQDTNELAADGQIGQKALLGLGCCCNSIAQ